MRLIIHPSSLSGQASPPGSKSHSMRAILFACMAEGKSTISNLLPSPDSTAMLAAVAQLGARSEMKDGVLSLTGINGLPQTPDNVIDAGNSGQVLRFIAALGTLQAGYLILSGDTSVRSLRPMQPLLDGLQHLGAFAVSSRSNGYAPVIIRGFAQAGDVEIDGQDSQPVSALLITAAFLNGTTRIKVKNPGETPWIELTLHWLQRFGVPFTNKNFTEYTVSGPCRWPGFHYEVPADWSSAAFLIGAALVTNAEITLRNMDFADPQGDKAILGALESMGAVFSKDEANKLLHIKQHKGLHGAELDVNDFIDAVPVLAAIACFADSPTRLGNAGIARHKESDRLAAIAAELGKMGAKIEEEPESIIIHPAKIHGAIMHSRDDHRIAMATAVAALGASSPSSILETQCISKSFPGFAASLRELKASVYEEKVNSQSNGDTR